MTNTIKFFILSNEKLGLNKKLRKEKKILFSFKNMASLFQTEIVAPSPNSYNTSGLTARGKTRFSFLYSHKSYIILISLYNYTISISYKILFVWNVIHFVWLANNFHIFCKCTNLFLLFFLFFPESLLLKIQEFRGLMLNWLGWILIHIFH